MWNWWNNWNWWGQNNPNYPPTPPNQPFNNPANQQTIYTEPQPGIRPGGMVDDSPNVLPPGQPIPPRRFPRGYPDIFASPFFVVAVVLIIIVAIVLVYG